MKNNVIQFTEPSVAAEVLRKLAVKLDNGQIEAVVIMANEPYPPEERENKESLGIIHRYWFSKGDIGCLGLLGLLDYSKELLLRYMFDDIDLIRGD